MYQPFAILLLPAAAIASDPGSKTDLAAVKGAQGIDGTTWLLVATVENGVKKNHGGNQRYAFRQGKMFVNSGFGWFNWRCFVDRTRTPYDITCVGAFRGVFERTGDTLRLRLGIIANPLKTLNSKDGNPAPLAILQRIRN